MALLRLSKAKVATKLDELALCRERLEALEELFNKEVQSNPKMLSIQAHMQAESAAAIKLQDEIKTAVLHYEQTIRGTQLQAVWSTGRTSWNSKALDGYSVAHPEMLQFKSVGTPTVSFRKV